MILIEQARRAELGQFLTASPIAEFMASLFEAIPKDVRLLDAGAGAGALSAAYVERCRGAKRRPASVAVTAYELDSTILPELRTTMDECDSACAERGIAFHADLIAESFLEAGLPLVRTDLLSIPKTPFNAAILNPPYRKINSNSAERRLLRAAGLETSNLYPGFLYLAARMLEPGGELVAIVPHSFCNGPYFRPFRESFFSIMSLRHIHLLASRKLAFKADGVLQENVIIHACKSEARPKEVTISTSSGLPREGYTETRQPYSEVISPDDPEHFVHLSIGSDQQDVRIVMARLQTSLAQLCLEVSTGKVVDFRRVGLCLKKNAPSRINATGTAKNFIQADLKECLRGRVYQDKLESSLQALRDQHFCGC